MIDIVCFDGEKFDLGFSKVYLFKEFNIAFGGGNNRNLLENKRLDILVSPERGRRKDFIHHRNSGLNHILCKIAKKNNIAIGISFNDILKSKEKDKLIGRIMQNMRLCRKYKVKMVLSSFATNKFEMRDARDLMSFGICVGMNPGEAKKALNFSKEKSDIKLIK